MEAAPRTEPHDLGTGDDGAWSSTTRNRTDQFDLDDDRLYDPQSLGQTHQVNSRECRDFGRFSRFEFSDPRRVPVQPVSHSTQTIANCRKRDSC